MKLNVNVFNDHEYCFYNKKPTYSKRFKSYVINYINRCIKTSIKNFQLIDLNEYDFYENINEDNILPNENFDNIKNDRVFLQFGVDKEFEDEYILDYKFPFTPIQAFGIGITCIQKKLLC